jgi:probable F420-dependent oxidoreductase
MRIDVRLSNVLASTAESARVAEATGYDAGWVGETGHDPFLPTALAAEHTRRLGVGTATAIAFARSPMTVAYQADDLARFSAGRFRLGLGSQVGTHVTDRFSMPWGRPVERMREYIAALRTIWAAWREERPLDFRGDFYRHTVMTRSFSPGPTDVAAPPVYLAAVGPRMAALAGQTADGLLLHLFSSPRSVREISLPALARGLAAAGRDRSAVEVVLPVFVVTGASERALEATRATIRRQLAFYASTPAYRAVMRLHGWEDLHWELYELSLAGDWATMAELIDDPVLDAFAVEGEPETIARRVWARYGGVCDRVVFSPEPGDDVPWPDIVRDLRVLSAAAGGPPAAQVAAGGAGS